MLVPASGPLASIVPMPLMTMPIPAEIRKAVSGVEAPMVTNSRNRPVPMRAAPAMVLTNLAIWFSNVPGTNRRSKRQTPEACRRGQNDLAPIQSHQTQRAAPAPADQHHVAAPRERHGCLRHTVFGAHGLHFA